LDLRRNYAAQERLRCIRRYGSAIVSKKRQEIVRRIADYRDKRCSKSMRQ
jgi:hypothetical protein